MSQLAPLGCDYLRALATGRTNAITTLAARPDLLDAVSGEVAAVRWLDGAMSAPGLRELCGDHRPEGEEGEWVEPLHDPSD